MVENWPRTFCKKKGQILASEGLKIEVTLWDDISNMRWAQKLLMWRLLLCTSTTNWKNNSSLGLRMMENGFYRLRCILPLGADSAPKGQIGPWKSTMKLSVYLIKGPRSQPNFFQDLAQHRNDSDGLLAGMWLLQYFFENLQTQTQIWVF